MIAAGDGAAFAHAMPRRDTSPFESTGAYRAILGVLRLPFDYQRSAKRPSTCKRYRSGTPDFADGIAFLSSRRLLVITCFVDCAPRHAMCKIISRAIRAAPASFDDDKNKIICALVSRGEHSLGTT